MWLWFDRPVLILPVAVLLKRFAAPRWLFIFGMVLFPVPCAEGLVGRRLLKPHEAIVKHLNTLSFLDLPFQKNKSNR
jgi:hypothetical protein